MQGFPNVFSTKEDFYNVRAVYANEVKKVLKEIMDGRFIWVTEKEVHDGEEFISNDTHRLLEATERDDETNKERKVYYQQILVEDPNSEFNRLGWTVEEAHTFINTTFEDYEDEDKE